ncbi:MAG: DUF4342 domain-containing protein [Actinobacteria bacterium]|nr:DUF4342 domain-containing protein [Actinomycetota bacterium]
MTEKTYTERIKVAGDQILSVVRTVIHEGNVRRLIIRNESDKALIEIPVTVGVVGVLVAPVAAALGAIAALVTHCTIEIERAGEAPQAAAPDEHAGGGAPAAGPSRGPTEEAAAAPDPAEGRAGEAGGREEAAGAATDAT